MLLVFVGLQRLFLPNVPQPAMQRAAEKEKADKAAGDVDPAKVDGNPRKPWIRLRNLIPIKRWKKLSRSVRWIA